MKVTANLQESARQGRRTGGTGSSKSSRGKLGTGSDVPETAHSPGFKRSGDGRGATPREHQKLPAAQLGSQRRLAREIATPAAVRWALNTFSLYKSPGPDGIYPVLLQRAGESIVVSR